MITASELIAVSDYEAFLVDICSHSERVYLSLLSLCSRHPLQFIIFRPSASMEGDNSELEIDSELVMSFYDQYQVQHFT